MQFEIETKGFVIKFLPKRVLMRMYLDMFESYFMT